MTPQNFREIAELLRSGTRLEPTDVQYAKVVQRGLGKKAPFNSDKNSVADAVIIELYATQFEQASPDDISCFVTSNHRDFSLPNGDHRQPHPDLADLFSGTHLATCTRLMACTTHCSTTSARNSKKKTKKSSSLPARKNRALWRK